MKQSQLIGLIGQAFDAGWKERNRRLMDGKIITIPYDDEAIAQREKVINDVIRTITIDREV